MKGFPCYRLFLQKICVPRPESPSCQQVFTFYLSNVGKDNPQGSFDCIRQHGGPGDFRLDGVGTIHDKITVCASDDSYEKARQSMTQAEEETRSRGAIVIKPGGRYPGEAFSPAHQLWQIKTPPH